VSSVYDPLSPGYIPEDGPAVIPAHSGEGNGLPSSLDDLRTALAQAEQVAEVEFPPCHLYGPGRFIRLECSTEITQAEMKKVQLAGLPPEQRRKRIPDPRKMDEAIVLATLVARQCVSVGLLQGDGSYKTVSGDLNDPTMLAQLGVMDPVMAVRRVFGNKDAYLLRAGQELVEACGYGEREPGDELDPT
jgi:hypothetical protein